MLPIEIEYKIAGKTIFTHTHNNIVKLIEKNESRDGRFRNWLNKGKNKFCKVLKEEHNIVV